MRTKLKEYIPLSDDERKRIWNEGVFVLDANALLNMCRYSKQSSDELLAILKTHKDNLWLPYQVAMEFFNNRISVIESIRKGFDGLLTNVSKMDDILEKELKLKEFRPDTALNIDQIRKDIKNFKNRTAAKIRKWKTEFEGNDNDALLEEILALYDGKVGDDYEAYDLDNIYKTGEKRYQENIPPGYADWKEKEKKSKRHAFGDLVWWKQAIDYAKANNKDLVIVTDDRKEDWWYKVSGKTIGPRVELIKEFDKETGGHGFLMYKPHQFMEMAKELDGAQVSDSSIREAEETSSFDYGQFMTMFGMGNDSMGYASLQPNSVLGSVGDNPMGYDPYRLRNGGFLRGSYDGRSLRSVFRTNPLDPSDGLAMGNGFSLYGEIPEGKTFVTGYEFDNPSNGNTKGEDNPK